MASQESRFQNYANDGRGGDLAPEQRGIAASLRLPHDAVGTDHGSLGVFQQQWPWWGTMRDLMDPASAAEKFYSALNEVEGWEGMSIGEAGQAVQRSAFPDAYDDDVALARKLLAAAGGTDTVAEVAYYGSTAECANTVFSGEVVMPLAGSGYVDAKNFGKSGSRWTKTHTGTDFSSACGTPVLASTGGTITVRTDQGWSGRWLVTLDAGESGVITWYAHMQSVSVASGDIVSPGQPIGAVGSEGNSTGCHLHFEVRPDGGDPINPSVWLAANVGKTVPVSDTTADASAVAMTAQVGASLSAKEAARLVGNLLRRKPDVLLLQEVEGRNLDVMVQRSRGRWGVWHPAGARGSSAIIWDRNQFAVTQRGNAFGLRDGNMERWMPWVVLQSQAGAIPVLNVHMPDRAPESSRRRRSRA
ncbi:M23 family metallopeptidase [Nocardioides daphniae]|uniref:M23 family metallopeptidase n=1 Tax=Nocardioides daphniae TaxID=402297 RepID=A0A4P7UGC9_9ACTN|nr:M23 family metallopeptidase [Nocardioides daphniae]QCC78421.1 M23 family metallopeptidase [Nocardioides daphniae]